MWLHKSQLFHGEKNIQADNVVLDIQLLEHLNIKTT
jgi:hypothetical protein